MSESLHVPDALDTELARCALACPGVLQAYLLQALLLVCLLSAWYLFSGCTMVGACPVPLPPAIRLRLFPGALVFKL